MHELSLANEILRLVEESIQDTKGEIKEITLKVGEFSGVMIDSLVFGLETLGKDILSENTKIEVEKIPLKVKCKECQVISKVEPHIFVCPSCDSNSVQIVSGEELELASIDIDAGEENE